jgi:hypothetical protein
MNKHCLGVLGILTSLFTSCDWQKSPDVLTQELADAELKTINWNELDQFPLFSVCDETVSKPKQQECFQSTLMLHLSMALQDFNLKVNNEISDTLYLNFKVDTLGSVSVLDISNHAIISLENPDFINFVDKRLKGLPKLEPALKRGIPVSAQFRVPLVIQFND